jgi:hypothetical protein
MLENFTARRQHDDCGQNAPATAGTS